LEDQIPAYLNSKDVNNVEYSIETEYASDYPKFFTAVVTWYEYVNSIKPDIATSELANNEDFNALLEAKDKEILKYRAAIKKLLTEQGISLSENDEVKPTDTIPVTNSDVVISDADYIEQRVKVGGVLNEPREIPLNKG
jgi:hypothetical protein